MEEKSTLQIIVAIIIKFWDLISGVEKLKIFREKKSFKLGFFSSWNWIATKWLCLQIIGEKLLRDSTFKLY